MSGPQVEFDRGTLLVRALPPALAQAELPGLTWDPRVRAWRAPGWRWAELAQALAARGISPPPLLGEAGPPVSAWRPPALRPYQAAALDAWELAGRRGIVVLPTGAGKTALALAAMARAGTSTLVLVPTRALLAQWRARLAEALTVASGVLGDGQRRLEPVTVATFESAWRHMPALGDRFQLLVVDEAHHFGAGGRDEALELSLAPLRLGLTATPPDDPRASLRLAELVGPVVTRLAIDDLQGAWLAELEHLILPVPLGPHERREHDRDRRSFDAWARPWWREHPQAGWEELQRAALACPEGQRALAAWRRAERIVRYPRAKGQLLGRLLARHRAQRTLVFVADVASAYEVAREHLVMPLTAQIQRRERAWALSAFERGELGALVAARVLDEGLDVPAAEVAIVVGGSASVRQHTQRVGRILRPGPGKRAVLYELVAMGTPEERRSRVRGAALPARGRA